MNIELELVDNGAVMRYPEHGINFVCVGKDEDIAKDLGKDILAEIAEKYPDKNKFKILISIKSV